MQLAVIFRILGILLSLFSLTMIPPLVISLFTKDGSATPFILAFVFWLTKMIYILNDGGNFG